MTTYKHSLILVFPYFGGGEEMPVNQVVVVTQVSCYIV